MPTNETLKWAQEIQNAIFHAISAHSEHVKSPNDAIRFHDKKTPYAVHPVWCAMTLLAEPKLEEEVRRIGYQALLWHDTIEDTNMPLPSSADDRVKALVRQMTFENFDQETRELWHRPLLVKLLKLYDKVSNLLDGTHMKDEKWNAYVDHTMRLTSEIEASFGELNITRIARAIGFRRETKDNNPLR